MKHEVVFEAMKSLYFALTLFQIEKCDPELLEDESAFVTPNPWMCQDTPRQTKTKQSENKIVDGLEEFD